MRGDDHRSGVRVTAGRCLAGSQPPAALAC
jgi:hypothetical protein